MGSSDTAQGRAVLALIAALQWQRLQDHFANVLGVVLRTVSLSRQLLTTPSWPSGLDPERVIRALGVGEELEKLLSADNAPQVTTTLTFPPAGVTYAAVPLRPVGGRPVAYVVVGPAVVGRREDAEGFRKRIASLGRDPELLWSVLLSLKQYSFASFDSVLRLLEEVYEALLELSYQSQQLRAMVPQVPRIDQAIVRHYAERLWHSLLDVASSATRAEGGSVMVYDFLRGAYRISVAHGIPAELINDVEVRLGEGLAGLAAQRQQLLLLDDQVADPELKARMRRPDLVSSLIVPVQPESARYAMGILNLWTRNPTLRFTRDHTELMLKLTQLAQTALVSLSPFTIIRKSD